ncbi:3-oxoacyl-[acyl-carrier-protein] synthase III C-terminal domain-containing protein [Streptomyces sp. NBC_01750]|uniref:3-oxoacyl-[acyl-carrier-protein] synthase III C-terminal domain-containing protein n=1 Tax=Streptomyces sp. NBC_01750 TaxID=2975928 RepID=UPI003FA38D64
MPSAFPSNGILTTFDQCGNLFGAGIPVALDRAICDGTVGSGSLVMLSDFAHRRLCRCGRRSMATVIRNPPSGTSAAEYLHHRRRHVTPGGGSQYSIEPKVRSVKKSLIL